MREPARTRMRATSRMLPARAPARCTTRGTRKRRRAARQDSHRALSARRSPVHARSALLLRSTPACPGVIMHRSSESASCDASAHESPIVNSSVSVAGGGARTMRLVRAEMRAGMCVVDDTHGDCRTTRRARCAWSAEPWKWRSARSTTERGTGARGPGTVIVTRCRGSPAPRASDVSAESEMLARGYCSRAAHRAMGVHANHRPPARSAPHRAEALHPARTEGVCERDLPSRCPRPHTARPRIDRAGGVP